MTQAQMEAQAKTEGGADAIRPFRVHFPDEALADLKRRIAATRWPDKEIVTDQSQGVQLATMQKLARYWATDYDWRKCEARLNALPQFVTDDRRRRHPLHPREVEASERAADDRHARLARLDHRAVEDHRSADEPHGARRERGGRVRRRDSVAAGLRVLREAHHDRLGSHPHRARVGRADEAPRIQAVRGAGRRLGQRGHGADGSAGRSGADRHSHQHAGHRAARHRQGGFRRRAGARGPLGGREARVRSARLLLQARPGLRQRDGEPPADALRDRGFAGRLGRLDARPRRGAAWRSSSASSTESPRG